MILQNILYLLQHSYDNSPLSFLQIQETFFDIVFTDE